MVNDFDYLALDAEGALYVVDRSMVVYDYSEALTLNRENFSHVLRICRGLPFGERVARKTTLSPRDIVVLQYEREGQTHRNWFVRVSFLGIRRRIHNVYYGAYFLWQLPHPRCARMARDLYAHAIRVGTGPSWRIAELLQPGEPTHMAFEPKHHVGRGTTLLNDLQAISSKVAVLCFGAALGPTPTPQWWGRPAMLYPSQRAGCLPGSEPWKLSELPDDLSDMILDRLVDNLVHGMTKRDARTLLALRRVNRRLRDKVDAAAAAWAQKKYEALNGAMESGNTHDLSAVGRSFLEAGIHPCLPYDMWRAGAPRCTAQTFFELKFSARSVEV